MTVDEWISKYDIAFSNDSAIDLYARADSAGGEQEHYYMAWYYSGVLSALRAKGRSSDLEVALDIPLRVIATATVLPSRTSWGSNTYLGWAATKTGNENVYGQGLWESYFWRYVATMLRVTKDSNLLSLPNNSLAGSTYQDNWNTVYDFILTNIWEKWFTYSPSDGFPVYRSRTHMGSHWARIAIELYELTGLQEYLTLYNNYTYLGMPSNTPYPGDNLKNQLVDVGGAYNFNSTWDIGDPVFSQQDSSHASDIISYFCEAYDLGQYWTITDIQKLIKTLNDIVWTTTSPASFNDMIDGSGVNSTSEAAFADWYTLARYDATLMSRMETAFPTATSPASKDMFVMGVAALSQAYQDNVVAVPATTSTEPPTESPLSGLIRRVYRLLRRR